MDWMPQAIRDGIIVVLVISGPLVLAAAFIGLVVGVLQAATQVQEQTIGSALKIIGVFALIIFAGFWMYQYLNQYTTRTLSSAFTFVPKQTQKAIPPHALEKETFKEGFEDSVRSAPSQESLKVAPPEEIEVPSQDGVQAGIPYLGSPAPPKPPSQAKITTPAIIPQLPKQITKPNIPLSDFQEPKPIPQESAPILKDQNLIQEEIDQTQNNEADEKPSWIN